MTRDLLSKVLWYRSNVRSHSLTLANYKCFNNRQSKGVALGLLASIHPMRNKINTTSKMGATPPLLAII